MPVGTYEKGKSPYGVYDMAGNVGMGERLVRREVL